MPPVICPRSAILHKAAASMVDGTWGFTVSIAERMATLGSCRPSATARSIAFCTIWTLSSSVGKMFTAASVMMTTRSISGTSMMKQWLMRRPVRSPESRLTTAAISSSVCRLPVISNSTLPSRASRTAVSADSTLCAASTRSSEAMSRPHCAASSVMRATGPTSTGRRSPISPASTAPRNELSSQGCATAQGTAPVSLQRAIRCRYFSCRLAMGIPGSWLRPAFRLLYGMDCVWRPACHRPTAFRSAPGARPALRSRGRWPQPSCARHRAP